MNIQAWSEAWELLIANPVPFGSVLVAVVVAVAGIVWFFRDHTAKERISALRSDSGSRRTKRRSSKGKQAD
jgi:hypothetical protein